MKRDEFKKLLVEQEERLADWLEGRLGKQLEQNDAVLTKRLEEHLADREERLEKRFADRMDVQLAKLFGQLTEYLDRQLDARIGPVEEKLDRLQATLDRDAKAVETDDHERAAISSKVDRHEGWIGQLADKTKTKLVPEL